MVGLLHTVLYRDIAVGEVASEGTAAHAIGILGIGGRSGEGVLAHGLVGCMDIEVAHPLDIGIADGCGGVVANHGCGVAVPTGEDGEPAALAVLVDKRLHHVATACGVKQGDERVLGTVGIPEREAVVIGGSGSAQAVASSKAGIVSIDIMYGMGEK